MLIKFVLGKKSDKQRSLDECVAQNLKECTDTLQVMVKYFCGTEDTCNKHIRNGAIDWSIVKQSTEIAKSRILREFYFVGLLEDFDVTLRLFEQLLPAFFKGTHDA